MSETLIEITTKMKKVLSADLGIWYRQREFSFQRCQGRLDVAVDVERVNVSCEEGILEVRFTRKKRYEHKSK